MAYATKEARDAYLKKYRQTPQYKAYHEAYMTKYRQDHAEEIAKYASENHRGWRDRTRTSDLHVRRDLLRRAKKRAAYEGVPFTITLDDIILPTHCPILGIELKPSKMKFRGHSPSLDKFIPALGYVPGNVYVISYRANTLKGNATLDEIEALAGWMRKITNQGRRQRNNSCCITATPLAATPECAPSCIGEPPCGENAEAILSSRGESVEAIC